MYRKILLITILWFLFSNSMFLYSQPVPSGPTIKVSTVFDLKEIRWIQHITISDPDGIKNAYYKPPGRNWETLRVDPLCNKIQTWVVKSSIGRVRDVKAEDCSHPVLADTISGARSQWHYDNIYHKTKKAIPIVVEWMSLESIPKENIKIISVTVTSGNLKDENGNTLDPSDFIPTGGGFRGFVAKVRGTGTVEIVMDPEGDLNIFEFEIISGEKISIFAIFKYLISVICGIFLVLLWRLLKKK